VRAVGVVAKEEATSARLTPRGKLVLIESQPRVLVEHMRHSTERMIAELAGDEPLIDESGHHLTDV
jgi:hypothetical protein